MGRKLFKRLIPLNEATQTVQMAIRGLRKVEEVEIEKAVGKTSAEIIVSKIDIPMYSKADVDGYAVNYLDVSSADETSPVRLRLLGRIGPEEIFQSYVESGCCVEVSTGSPIPLGSNAVVPVEHTEERGGYVLIYRKARHLENILKSGTDFRIGDVIVWRGERINESKVAALAAIGVKRIKVYATPIVGIISTGNELVPPGESISSGKVYDVNSYLLASCATTAGFKVKLYGIVRDELESLRERLTDALKETDLVIISGGSSVGTRDLVHKIFEEMGSRLEFHGLLLKPGRPTGFGMIRGKPVFCLPGNPVSSIVAFLNLVIRAFQSNGGFRGSPVETTVFKRYFPARGRREVVPSILVRRKSDLIAYPLSGSSGSIIRLYNSDGYFTIPEETEIVSEGTRVEFTPWFGEKPTDLLILGEIDSFVTLLSGLIQERIKLKIRWIRMGLEEAAKEAKSIGAILSIKSRENEDQTEAISGLDGWIELASYVRSFGLFSSDASEEIKAMGFPPGSVEYDLQPEKIGNIRIRLIGHLGGCYEALRYVERGMIDAFFFYRVPWINKLDFHLTGKVKTTLLLPPESENLLDPLRTVVKEATDLVKSIPELRETIELRPTL